MNKYTVHVSKKYINTIFDACKYAGVNIVRVSCSKDYYIVTYMSDFRIKGDFDEV